MNRVAWLMHQDKLHIYSPCYQTANTFCAQLIWRLIRGSEYNMIGMNKRLRFLHTTMTTVIRMIIRAPATPTIMYRIGLVNTLNRAEGPDVGTTHSNGIKHDVRFVHRTHHGHWTASSRIIKPTSCLPHDAKHCRAQYCHGKVVCPSVCHVEGPWSHRLEFFENNFTADYLSVSTFTDIRLIRKFESGHPESRR